MGHPNIASALLAARSEFPPIHKTKPVKVRTKSGADYTFMYAPHDAINDVTVPVLGKHGLTMVQPLSNLNGHPAIRTVLLHESGDSLEDTFPLPLRPDMTAQEVGSAITYVRRYAWVSMLGLVADEDDDGNHASGNTVKAGASSSAPQGQATDAAVNRTETPAPAAASPAQAIVQKAQKAYENRPGPTDGGNPGDVEIHFGKNQGKRLSELSKKQVEWYATTWEPNPKYESTDDKRLKTAAQLLAGLEPAESFSSADFPSDADSIPF